MDSRRLQTIDDARALLVELGAPARLIRHGLLVAEAAEELLSKLREWKVSLDEAWVRVGAVLHDAGKILHDGELHAPGALHEEAGQAMLLAVGVEASLARCCVSHARWSRMAPSLEELLVALADALWKGVRRPELEARIVDEVASMKGVDRWTLFIDLDTCFEAIAYAGPERLQRSREEG